MAVGIAPGINREDQWHMSRSKVEWSDAAKAAKEKCKAEPYNAKAWYDLGCILEEESLWRESVDCFSMALIFDPFNADYYMHRGHRYLSIGEVASFTADFEMCLRIDPKNWWALYYIQEGFTAMGYFDKAEEYCKRLWEISDENTQFVDAVAVWYCEALGRNGKWDKYNEIINTPFLVKMMDDPETKTPYIGRLRFMAGRVSDEEMLKRLDEIPADHPMADAMFCGTAWALIDKWYSKGETAKADELCAKAAKRDKNTWQLTAYFLSYFEAKRRGLID